MKFQDKEEVTSDEIGKAFALVSPECDSTRVPATVKHISSHQNLQSPVHGSYDKTDQALAHKPAA